MRTVGHTTYRGPMLVAISVAPSTPDPAGGVSDAVARAVAVIRESGLPYETTAMFTTLEGEWDEIMTVVKAAVDAAGEGAPRVSLVLKADIRPGYTNQLEEKVRRIEDQLRE